MARCPSRPRRSRHRSPSSSRRYRVELTGYCYRMLGSLDAEDAVQETFIRAWRAYDSFEGRSALRSWLYRIATNVCYDMLESRKRRARPMDLGPAGEPIVENLRTPDQLWIEPMPDALVVPDGDPAAIVGARESVRLAFVAALQQLPARQRAVLILCEVLRWKAAEVAELLETSVASVNSALQRARATLEASDATPSTTSPSVDAANEELLQRYVTAFEQYDMDALTSLIREDATQSMPPFDLWLTGRDDIFTWWFGPGNACRGSRVVPVESANGAPAFGQYKPREDGEGYEPWALQVVEIEDGQHRRAHVLPRRRDRVPALRLAARVSRLGVYSSKKSLDDLGVAGHPLAEDEELEPVRTGFEASRHRRADPNRVQPFDLDLVVVQTKHPGAREDDVHLHGLLVPVAESVMLAGLDDLVRDAERVETEIGSCEARLLELREAALYRHVLDFAEVLECEVSHGRRVARTASTETSPSGSRPRSVRSASTCVRPMSSTTSSRAADAFRSLTSHPSRRAAS